MTDTRQGDIALLSRCELCDMPMHPGTGRTPRKRHDECRLFLCHFRAAVRLGTAALGAKATAAALRAEASRLMAGQWERDEAGRFAGRR